MFICIWCEDKNRGIGKNNKLPWHVKQDFEFFKQTTFNHSIVMGKNTFLSIGKPLPKRTNIVISTTLKIDDYKDLIIYKTLDAFLKDYQNKHDDIYIIGGKKIYDFFIPLSEKLYVSKLKQSYDCDVFMTNKFDNFEISNIQEFEEFNLYTYIKKTKR